MTARRLFVCGMLRSGTTLIQTLLTNHPDMLVGYQPFHQFYVDAKRMFLEERGVDRALPLDDGSPANRAEREDFPEWLASRRFTADEAASLARRATSGKGGGASDWQPPVPAAGSFFDLHARLHESMAAHLGRESCQVVGSKEILCEEYIPALLDAGIRCVLIIRDPRGVIASANHGRYRDMVGDRYPLMMLIRLWRKSAAYWLRYRQHPLVHAIRYEDLAAVPEQTLAPLADWIGTMPFPRRVFEAPLHDHAGRPWQGNSSFGDKPRVDATSREGWRTLLDPAEHGFISACTSVELDRIGYRIDADVKAEQILDFQEDTNGVRESYLRMHPLDMQTLEREAERLSWRGGRRSFDEAAATEQFLFPDALADASSEAIDR